MAVVESAISSRLANYSGLTALTSRIFAVIAPDSAATPFVTWRIFNETVMSNFGSDSTPTEVSLQVSIFADDFDSVVNIGIQVKAALQRFRGTVNSVVIQDTFYEGYNDRFDNDGNYYQRDMDFRVFYEE